MLINNSQQYRHYVAMVTQLKQCYYY